MNTFHRFKNRCHVNGIELLSRLSKDYIWYECFEGWDQAQNDMVFIGEHKTWQILMRQEIGSSVYRRTQGITDSNETEDLMRQEIGSWHESMRVSRNFMHTPYRHDWQNCHITKESCRVVPFKLKNSIKLIITWFVHCRNGYIRYQSMSIWVSININEYQYSYVDVWIYMQCAIEHVQNSGCFASTIMSFWHAE